MFTVPGLRFTNQEFLKRVRAATISIIVHHTGVAAKHTVLSIHNGHIRRGWAGIGYHYVIGYDGLIWTGRPDTVRGVHAGNHNSTSVGVALLGNFEVQDVYPDQLNALRYLVRMLRIRYPYVELIGHKDVSNTLCPGKKLYRHLEFL